MQLSSRIIGSLSTIDHGLVARASSAARSLPAELVQRIKNIERMPVVSDSTIALHQRRKELGVHANPELSPKTPGVSYGKVGGELFGAEGPSHL